MEITINTDEMSIKLKGNECAEAKTEVCMLLAKTFYDELDSEADEFLRYLIKGLEIMKEEGTEKAFSWYHGLFY